ncbi:hypothetical protein U6A24_04155 [Aquimarina gracilis]|uniref:Lipoprotein n=1 Tax=Aquimarina gracilis TaxID=874422 RepID=A0ABU5ZRF8_9FLAO|nr:hypothetical protein [Aquimarina gracilis]MEB3344639.1 hypothetical protein [Aquimarina gracilis]
MKNRVIAFLSILMVSSTFLISCQDDDNDPQVPTTQVTTSKQFEEVEAANTEITTTVETVFGSESGFLPATGKFANKMPDCATITSEVIDSTRTIVIDFGDGCEVNGETISGSIRMSFAIELDGENKALISYSLENFVYNDITVSGSATTTFTFNNNMTDGSYSSNYATTSDFTFAWADGMTATSQTNFSNETFFNINPDNPEEFEYYSLNSGSSSTTFSNGDIYSVEITTPLRNERGCAYIVSGAIVTNENSETTTLDFGDGECDNIAIQTDGDGNETTIEL